VTSENPAQGLFSKFSNFAKAKMRLFFLLGLILKWGIIAGTKIIFKLFLYVKKYKKCIYKKKKQKIHKVSNSNPQVHGSFRTIDSTARYIVSFFTVNYYHRALI
jgi:hypothetical protein